MKAAQINSYGDASVINIVETEKPTLQASQVLVEVRAASINPFDSKLRQGAVKDMIPLTFPATLGGDIAGVVSEIGEDVSGFAVGDQVYGQALVVAGGSGAFANYAAAPAEKLAPMPSNLTFTQAAALPLVGVSALQGLTEHIKLRDGQKIFIHGGAGGIGSIAIQIATQLGAYVATTATGDGLVFVKNLGADEIIDYKQQDFTETVKGYDAVFDTVGGEDFTKALEVLKRGGVAVSMIAQADETKATELGVTAFRQSTVVTTERLQPLRELVEKGIVTPQVDKVFPLENIVAAFQAQENSTVHGKVVIEVSH